MHNVIRYSTDEVMTFVGAGLVNVSLFVSGGFRPSRVFRQNGFAPQTGILRV